MIFTFIAAWIAFQIAFVAGAHTVFYVRAARSGLEWSVQDYVQSLGVTMLGAFGIWARAIGNTRRKLGDIARTIGQKLGAKC